MSIWLCMPSRSLLRLCLVAVLAMAGLAGADTPDDPGNSALPGVIDLTPYYGKVFRDPYGSDSTYRGYAGRKTIDGLPFDIGGEVVLWGRETADRGKDYPDAISGVKIGRQFAELHLIHAVQWREYKGCPVATVRLHYADGTSSDFAIRFDYQVNDWSRLYTEDEEIVADPDTKIIWRGDGSAEGTGRLFKSLLRNPFPGKTVDTMEIISAGSGCSYVLVAATVAGSDRNRPVTKPMPLLPARHFDGTLVVHVVDDATGTPIAGAEVYPAMVIGDISLVADNVLTGAAGDAPVKYPKEAGDLRLKVSKAGYATCEDNWQNGWQAGKIPPVQSYRLKPKLDARPLTGRLKPLAAGAGNAGDYYLYLTPVKDPTASERTGQALRVRPGDSFSCDAVALGKYTVTIQRDPGDGHGSVEVYRHDIDVLKNTGSDPGTPVDLGEIECISK